MTLGQLMDQIHAYQDVERQIEHYTDKLGHEHTLTVLEKEKLDKMRQKLLIMTSMSEIRFGSRK